MTLSVSLTSRDFLTPLSLPGLDWSVERLEWSAVGGPRSARLRAAASGPGALWALSANLRCALTVIDDAGAPGWWGYIHAITLVNGGAAVRVSLDDFANRVRASYLQPAPLWEEGQSLLTGWAEDAGSVREWGRCERTIRIGQADEPEAEARRDMALSMYAQPGLETFPRLSRRAPRALRESSAPENSGEKPYAIIEARGWWQTLDWTCYNEPRGWCGHNTKGTAQVFGSGAAPGKVAQSFTLATAEGWSAGEVWLRARRWRAPADQLQVELCADANGQPGAVLAAAQLPGARLPEELDWLRLPLTAPLALAAATPYWLVVSRSGPADGLNYYSLSVDEGVGYPNGVLRTWNGTAWVPRADDADLNFVIGGVESPAEQLRRMLGAAQFFTGVRIDIPIPDAPTRLFRGGQERLAREVSDLLSAGDGSGAPLLAHVTPGRVVRVFPRPAPSTAMLTCTADGAISGPGGRPLRLSEQPAGQWLRLGAQALPNLRGPVFVNEAVWEGGRFEMK